MISPCGKKSITFDIVVQTPMNVVLAMIFKCKLEVTDAKVEHVKGGNMTLS